jgi:hypothetical protein
MERASKEREERNVKALTDFLKRDSGHLKGVTSERQSS